MRGLGKKKLGVWTTVVLAGCLLALLGPPVYTTASGAVLRPPPLSNAPWSPNVRVNDDAGVADQIFPSIAVDDNGNAYAVWSDYRERHSDIYFSYRPACGSWNPNIRVDDNLVANTQWPAIAVDASGNAYAVWQDHRNDFWNPDIYFSYRPAGGVWGINVKVNDDEATESHERPAIAVDPEGNAYVVWQDKRNGLNPDIYFSYRPAGGNWGASGRVSDAGGVQAKPAIAVDASGNAYAVWEDSSGLGWNIYFSHRPAGGSWSPSVRVNDYAGKAHQGYPSIAVDASGNAYAAWWDMRSGSGQIYFAYRPAGGIWGANVKVNDDGTIWRNLHPSIDVDPKGNAYAAWHDFRNGLFSDIYFSYRSSGDSWGPNGRVDDDAGTAFQVHPSIAVDGTGNAYVVWSDSRNGDADIYFSSTEVCPIEEEEFVPELGAVALLGGGLAGLAGYATLRRH